MVLRDKVENLGTNRGKLGMGCNIPWERWDSPAQRKPKQGFSLRIHAIVDRRYYRQNARIRSRNDSNP